MSSETDIFVENFDVESHPPIVESDVHTPILPGPGNSSLNLTLDEVTSKSTPKKLTATEKLKREMKEAVSLKTTHIGLKFFYEIYLYMIQSFYIVGNKHVSSFISRRHLIHSNVFIYVFIILSCITVILRTLLYCIGLFCLMMFFFNFISLIIGILFFSFLRGSWSHHGLFLSFTCAITSAFTLGGIQALVGLYPLSFVCTISYLMMFIYFVIYYTIFSTFCIMKIVKKIRESKVMKFFQKIKKYFVDVVFTKVLSLIWVLLLLIFGIFTISLWISYNINFGLLLNNYHVMLWINIPSIGKINDTFIIKVQSWDKYERISNVYDGTVYFSLLSYNITNGNELQNHPHEYILPNPYTFKGDQYISDRAFLYESTSICDHGKKYFKANIFIEGIHYVKIYDSNTKKFFISNPIIIKENPKKFIYWGDIHTHSGYSDASGSPNDVYMYAKYKANLNYYSLTDHGEIVSLNNPFLGTIESYIKTTQKYNKENEFVTFLGYEYTNHHTGHYTCIFNGDDVMVNPLPNAMNPTAYLIQNPNELWKLLDDFTERTGSKVITLPHHTVKLRYLQDWSYYNPKYVKLVEVSSTHGDCLYEPWQNMSYRGSSLPAPYGTKGASITAALKMGRRVSIYGSSDAHDGHPGKTMCQIPDGFVGHQYPLSMWWTRQDKPYPGAITAVFARNLSRSEIFNRLYNRYTFATSDYGRSLLWFTINGIGVGENNSTIILPTAQTKREIKIFFAQDGSPPMLKRQSACDIVISNGENYQPNFNATIEVLKNGILIYKFIIISPVTPNLTYIDRTTIMGSKYGKENCKNRNGQWFVNDYSDNPIENPDDLNSKNVDFYIIRAVGDNGRHSYIGPLWVTFEGALN